MGSRTLGRLRIVVAGALISLALTAQAEAITVRDIVELTKAGLGDEILIALIEADDSRFDVDAQTALELSRLGVSERVLLEMIRRSSKVAEPVPPPEVPLPPMPESPSTPRGGWAEPGVRWFHGGPLWVPAFIVVQPGSPGRPPTTTVPPPALEHGRFGRFLQRNPGDGGTMHLPAMEATGGRFLNDGFLPGRPTSAFDIGRWASDADGASNPRR